MNVIYEFPIHIDNSRFTFKANLNEMLGKGVLKEGIWDLYVNVENKHYRIASRMDNIQNKQKIISFPQQLVKGINSNAIVVKPYYTMHNCVSLLIRNYTYSKSINRININDTRMEIHGKINIMVPNDEIPNQVNGSIFINGRYGKSYDFPAIWKLRKTNKTNVEFEFSVTATFPEDKMTKMKDWVLDNITFESIICNLDFGEIQSRFPLNIRPEKIDKSFEDKLNNVPKIKRLMGKGKLTFYRIINKILPVQENTYVFQSYYGNSYACNPKAIYEELLLKHKKIKAVWVMKDLRKDIPGKPILVKPNSIKYFFTWQLQSTLLITETFLIFM